MGGYISYIDRWSRETEIMSDTEALLTKVKCQLRSCKGLIDQMESELIDPAATINNTQMAIVLKVIGNQCSNKINQREPMYLRRYST